MNRMLLILVLVVFMAVGALFFYSEDTPSSTPARPVAEDAPAEEEMLPPLTEADRDTYANTIKTMNARNNELLQRLEAMDRRLQEKEKAAIKTEEVERLVSQRVEERARNLTSTFTEKFNQIRGDVSQRLKNRPAGKIDSAASAGMPSGLGFDNLPGGLQWPGSGPTPLTLGGGAGIVTILPVTMIGTTGEGEAIPVAIDGSPLPGSQLPPQSGLVASSKRDKAP
ncbi:MAG: hypothetical protein ABFR65_13005, partial [Pseudomonadota bacterium]